MNKVYILLGSNMGNSQQQFILAKKHIEKKIGPIIRQSNIYKTAAWGNIKQADFLNQVIVIKTKYNASATLEIFLKIEKILGRIRTEKNAPRPIDIDILFFNKDIIQTKNLIVPHPALQNRRFTLIPLNQLSPSFIHPVLNKTIHQILLDCPDKLAVKKI
ncbi:MAG: 2-amino-4-hydroxy-6-hydroxymethyldihydropteridine diphosphokinase [Ferruginibacter sp.]